jgi:hypothetical protein
MGAEHPTNTAFHYRLGGFTEMPKPKEKLQSGPKQLQRGPERKLKL